MIHTLCLNIDEIGKTTAEAFPFYRKNHLNTVELRTLNGKNIADFTIEEAVNEREKLEQLGLSVCAIASPLFKWYEQHPFSVKEPESYKFPYVVSEKRKLDAINSTIKNAQIFSANKVRIFSGLREGEPNIDEVLNNTLFSYTVKKGLKSGIKVLLENEPICHVHKLKDIRIILEKTKNLGLWLDVANFYQSEENMDWKDIEDLLPYTHHIHLKDFAFTVGNQIDYVPLGQGCIPWNKIFPLLHEKSFHQLTMSIETHIEKDKAKAIEQSIEFYRQFL